MVTGFRLFSWPHLLLLAGIPAGAFALAQWARRRPAAATRIRLALGTFLLLNAAAWYVWNLSHGWFRFPDGLPIQISDLVAWVAMLAAFTLKEWFVDVAYYVGLSTAYMALVTPDLWAPLWSYPTIRFFTEHGGVVLTVLFLIWSRSARPRPGSVWRAFLVVNVYAAAIFVFDMAFDVNYFYVRQKPAQFSPLDFFGPWPVYLVVTDLIALAAFWLMWLPYRRREPG